MELAPEQLKEIRVDSILVEMLVGPETRRGFYIPDSARKAVEKRRKAGWEGRVVRLGAEIDQDQWKPHAVAEGDVVFIAPEAIDCPSFCCRYGDEVKRFVFVRDEDIIGKRVE